MNSQYLSVRVSNQWYAIPLASVLEVHHLMMLTEHPNSVAHVVGLMTLRDIIFPVIDLRLSFGVANPTYHLDTPIVVLQGDHGVWGVIVDESDAVENVSDEQISGITTESFAYVQGTVRLPNRLLLKLDVAKLAFALNS